MDGQERSETSFVGYEWEYVEEQAAELGLRVERILTAPPRGMGSGALRVIRQQERDGVIVCTCAAEEWGETR